MAQTHPATHQLAAGVGAVPRLAAHRRRDRICKAAAESDFSGYAAHLRTALSEARFMVIRIKAKG